MSVAKQGGVATPAVRLRGPEAAYATWLDFSRGGDLTAAVAQHQGTGEVTLQSCLSRPWRLRAEVSRAHRSRTRGMAVEWALPLETLFYKQLWTPS